MAATTGSSRSRGERDWIIEDDLDFQIALILRNILDATEGIRSDLRKEAEKALDARLRRSYGEVISSDQAVDGEKPVRGTGEIVPHQ